MKKALKKMEAYLVTNQLGEANGDQMRDVAMAYLTSVLLPTLGNNAGERSRRELTTLAAAIDMIVSGRMAEAGDLLVQRFKAVETAAATGTWGVAQHLEIAPRSQVSTVQDRELEAAARLERDQYKLRQALGRGYSRASGH